MAKPGIQLSYGNAKQKILDVLLLCAAEHDSGRPVALDSTIDKLFDYVDSTLPRFGGSEFDKLTIALEFCAGWLDSSIHGWKFYKGIESADWPRLARLVVADLEADREISDPLVLSHFGPVDRVNEPSLFERLKRFFSR